MSSENEKKAHIADLIKALSLLFPKNTLKRAAILLEAPRSTINHLLYGNIVISPKRLADWNAKLDRALDADQKAAEIKEMRYRLRSHMKGNVDAQISRRFGRDGDEDGSQTA
jgi:hypothetical protein